jgi:hypothetical protein
VFDGARPAASAPPGCKAAFQYAINDYQNTYSDPITINLIVGWGGANGQPFAPGFLGE